MSSKIRERLLLLATSSIAGVSGADGQECTFCELARPQGIVGCSNSESDIVPNKMVM